MSRTWLLLLALAVGCSSGVTQTASPEPLATPSLATLVAPSPAPAQTAGARCHYRASGDLPDPTCTPGAYDPAFTVALACGGRNQARRSVPESEKARIAKAYGVARASVAEFDHLIPNALGGAQDDRNIWPEPSKAAKDAVEAHVLAAVCHNRMTLHAAQTAFAHDWRTLR